MAQAPRQTNAQAPTTAPETPDTAKGFALFDDLSIPDRRVRQSKYPWDELQVGQAFFAPNVRINAMATLVSTRNKYGEPKYIAREWTNSETGQRGVMVWRKA